MAPPTVIPESSLGPRSVTVIGGGIVGMASALFLQRDGHAVTVIDPREPGDGASFGNAGVIASSAVAPIAMPGIIRELPAMLRDPHGPLSLRVRHLPRLAPWLIRLARSTRTTRVDAISTALTGLMQGVDEAYAELFRLIGGTGLYRRTGWLKVYGSQAAFDRTADERDLMRWHGVRFDILNGDEVRQLEPGLSSTFVRGLFFPDCGLVVDPKRLVMSLAAAFVAGGGGLFRETAQRFATRDGRRLVVTDRASYATDAIVLAAGIWSRPLARALGARVPLEAERGYHLMFDHAEPGLRRPVMWGEYAFGLSPMEHGIRLTGGVELASAKAAPDYRKIDRIAALARTMLPSLPAEPRSRWLGLRPSLPDSLPVLGRSGRHPGIYFAFGHQHLGLTLGAVSGRIIADLVAGRDPGLDLTPYRAERW